MSVKPILGFSQDNYIKRNVSFGSYESQITKEALSSALSSTYPALKKDAYVVIPEKIWQALESIKQTYKEDKLVDIKTFINGPNIWALVKPADEVKEMQAFDGVGQHNLGVFKENIFSLGEKLKKDTITYADELRQKFGFLLEQSS